MIGPSLHISWNELACWNHQQRRFGRFSPGELVAAYPQQWRDTRAVQIADNFEAVRALLGNVPMAIHSAYRTEDYNALVGGAKMSQHVQGRALDFTHKFFPPREVFLRLKEAAAAGKLPLLGGLGSYKTFVHMDVRPKVGGHLAVWIA